MHFQIDDPTVLGDWMTSVQRERYTLVKEERDMYHSMQLHFSSEMEEKNKNINARDNEKVDMEKVVADANQQVENAFNTIKRLLAVVAVNDDSLIDPTACDSIGPAALALEKGVNELRANLSKEVFRVAELKGKEHNELNKELDAIAEALRLEKKAKEDAQKQASDDKDKADIERAVLNNKVEILRKQNEELKFGGKIAEESAIKEVTTLCLIR
jgi:predicted  nucleic acid-binding Zn-ribbon protein